MKPRTFSKEDVSRIYSVASDCFWGLRQAIAMLQGTRDHNTPFTAKHNGRHLHDQSLRFG
jgi:hypothetical protein